MQALQTRREMESWQRCDEEPSRNPRQAVAEWFGHGSVLDKRKTVSPRTAYGQVSRGGKSDFIRRLAQKKYGWRACDLTDLWINAQNRLVLCEFKTTNLPLEIRAAPVSVASLKIIQDFNERAERWRRDTSFQSSLVAQFMHEDYQFIMAKGTEVIPLILGRLKKTPENWFWALKHLAGEDVAKDTDNPADAAKAWLNWGRKKGYID